MSKSTISTFEFLKAFSTEKSAKKYITKHRWPSGVTCPCCNEARRGL